MANWVVFVMVVVTPVAAEGMISMASTLALSVVVVKAMVILPLLSAVVVKVWTTALLAPPAAVKMSKLVRTATPLMETLKRRWLAAVHQVSAKWRRTVQAEPGVRPGMM